MPRPKKAPKPPPTASARPGTKRGLTLAETAIIRDGMEQGMTDAEIAAIIGRREDVVTRARVRLQGLPGREDPPTDRSDVRDRPAGVAANPKNRIIAELRASVHYRQLKRACTPDELRTYEDQYADIVYQFGDDITPTERVSVHKVVYMSVQMARNAEDQLRARMTAARYQAAAAAIESGYPDLADTPRSDLMQRKLDNHLAAAAREEQRLTTLVRDHNSLSAEQQRLFEDLKSTRNQRLDRVTKVRTIQDLLRELTDEANREREGRRAEIMRRSMAVEAGRLATPFTYADGRTDLPLLTPDTVGGEAADAAPAAPADSAAPPEAARE